MITKEQDEKIRRAITSAQQPGECLYVANGQPCCIIAQLATLEGLEIEELTAWDMEYTTHPDGTKSALNAISTILDRNPLAQHVFTGYDTGTLAQLQRHWDRLDVAELTVLGSVNPNDELLRFYEEHYAP